MKPGTCHELSVCDFNLDYTLSSGQVFNWENKDGFWYGVIGDGIFKIRQRDSRLLFITNLPAKKAKRYIKRYFNLGVSLLEIKRHIDKDKNIHKAISTYKGLRVINIPPWECAVSYILSQNANIPRIKKMIRTLCSRYGKRLSIKDYIGYTFPTADKILKAGLGNLRKLKLGFRVEYLFEFAKQIKKQKNFLEYLEKCNYDNAKCKLDSFLGIGPKVADCILLYGCNKTCAFPVDVWIRRAIKKFYLTKKPDIKDKDIEKFARNYFGRYAGWAQLYLYCYIRKEDIRLRCREKLLKKVGFGGLNSDI